MDLILPGVTGCYLVQLTGFIWKSFLTSFAECCQVFATFYLVWPGFTGFFFTGRSRVFLNTAAGSFACNCAPRELSHCCLIARRAKKKATRRFSFLSFHFFYYFSNFFFLVGVVRLRWPFCRRRQKGRTGRPNYAPSQFLPAELFRCRYRRTIAIGRHVSLLVFFSFSVFFFLLIFRGDRTAMARVDCAAPVLPTFFFTEFFFLFTVFFSPTELWRLATCFACFIDSLMATWIVYWFITHSPRLYPSSGAVYLVLPSFTGLNYLYRPCGGFHEFLTQVYQFALGFPVDFMSFIE